MTKSHKMGDVRLCTQCGDARSAPCIVRVVTIKPLAVMPMCIIDEEDAIDPNKAPCGVVPISLGPTLEPKEYVGYLL